MRHTFTKQATAAAILFLIALTLSAQEALKSTEEEYYDFLSLTGVTERPTLGYRTLSDSTWHFNTTERFEPNADGTFSLVRTSGENSVANVWKNNNLGKRRTLWHSTNQSSNWFMRGIDQGITLKIYGPEWYNSYNTAAPYGQNDGSLWQGKGYNTSLTGGARLEAYGFELTLKPQLSFSQNAGFEYIQGVNGDPHSYFVGGIDLVQRYGETPFWTFDWGDTEARWSWHSLTLGFGTQTPWLGPAWLNPMLGSNNAPTYPKADFGLRRTRVVLPWLGWYIGDIEARTWVGMLTESDYFTDPNNESKRNMVTGLSASFAPSFIPGLTLGANRIFLCRWKPQNLKYWGRLFTLSSDNDVSGEGEDQKASIFADWQFPAIGFEAYGEYGFDDFTSSKITNPFHTGIYTVGIKQTIPMPQKLLHNGIRANIIAELNNFEMSQDFQLQWQYGGYYFHSKIKQGYTNKGQILGAGTGSMGNSQYAGINVFFPKGEVTFFFHRYCPNNNYIYNKAVDTDASSDSTTSTVNKDYYASYETYNGAGGKLTYFVTNALSVAFEFDLMTILASQYDLTSHYIPNLYFALTARYAF